MLLNVKVKILISYYWVGKVENNFQNFEKIELARKNEKIFLLL